MDCCMDCARALNAIGLVISFSVSISLFLCGAKAKLHQPSQAYGQSQRLCHI